MFSRRILKGTCVERFKAKRKRELGME